jgi:hypothetical protein
VELASRLTWAAPGEDAKWLEGSAACVREERLDLRGGGWLIAAGDATAARSRRIRHRATGRDASSRSYRCRLRGSPCAAPHGLLLSEALESFPKSWLQHQH